MRAAMLTNIFISTFVPFVVFGYIALPVYGHGYLREPISRTSIQQRPEFNTSQPYWWDHQAVWCGNEPQDLTFSRCGRCGDAYGETSAAQGGIYDKGVIVSSYAAGAVSNLSMDFSAAHFGHFLLELCPEIVETDDCFQRLPILTAGPHEVREGNRVCVPWDHVAPSPITVQVQLPSGISCERCTLRWTYRTSYPGRPDWDICDDWELAQTFRNCADVKIV